MEQPWQEGDYKQRKYISELQFLYEAEEQVLAFKKENVKCFVIAAGLLYGIEEIAFREHFEVRALLKSNRLDGFNHQENCNMLATAII